MNIILAILVIILLFGGTGYHLAGPYQYGSYGLGGLLVIVLIILALSGRI